MTNQLRRRVFIVLVISATITGCAARTRSTQVGLLSSGEPLVTLIVTEDPDIVLRVCDITVRPRTPDILRCVRRDVVPLRTGGVVETITIVRYANSLRVAPGYERDARMMCRASAAYQSVTVDCDGPTVGRPDNRLH